MRNGVDHVKPTAKEVRFWRTLCTTNEQALWQTSWTDKESGDTVGPTSAFIGSATSDHSPDGSWSNQNWPDKCREVLQKVLDNLGLEKQWFDRPVDEYYIPGYYSRVKSPMDLGAMTRKLDHGKYKGPQGFCEVNRPLNSQSSKDPAK